MYDFGMDNLLDIGSYKGRVHGEFGYHLDQMKHGKGPEDPGGFAWWYTQTEYPNGITTVSCGNACVSEAELSWPVEWSDPSLVGPPPAWSKSSQPPTTQDINDCPIVYEVAAGWPVQSWYGAIRSVGIQKASFQWSFAYSKVTGFDPIILPYQPMRGLFVNALVFGVPAYFCGLIFFSSCRKVRGCIRQRRGLCPHCAYDITGLSTCPECGQEVISKA